MKYSRKLFTDFIQSNLKTNNKSEIDNLCCSEPEKKANTKKYIRFFKLIVPLAQINKL